MPDPVIRGLENLGKKYIGWPLKRSSLSKPSRESINNGIQSFSDKLLPRLQLRKKSKIMVKF
jgi:hypothetical protein